MSSNSDFIESLLQIPYFSALAKENGTEWLADLLTTLDVEDYDLAQLAVSKALANGIGSDASNLLVSVDPVNGLDPTISVDGSKSQKLAKPAAVGEVFSGLAEFYKPDAKEATVTEAPSNESSVFDNIGTSTAAPVLVLPDPTFDDGGRYFSRLLLSYLEFNEASLAWAKERANLVFETGNQNILLNGANEVTNLGDGDDNVYLSDRGPHKGFETTHVRGGEGIDSLYLYRDEKHFGVDRELSGNGFTVTLGDLNDFGAYGGKVELTQIENVFGSNEGDIITGDRHDNLLDGRDGNDDLSGGAGADTLKGRAGDDTIDGGGGNDTILGGDGKNELKGGAGNDKITGGLGIDIIDGGDGDDTMIGGGGADTLTSGDGNDTLEGGKGADKITGGAGADTYVYLHVSDSLDGATERDIITDFDAAHDQFDFSDIGLSTDVAPDKFLYIGTGAFTGKAGEVRYTKNDLAGTDNDTTLISIDNNGDKIADMEIQLTGLVTLEAKNFEF